MGVDFNSFHHDKTQPPSDESRDEKSSRCVGSEPETVKYTIVGGRPPAAGARNRNIPRGMEVLIKKAAVDPAFRLRLLSARSAAATDINLSLEPSERMMLDAIPAQQLETIIDNTRVPKDQLKAFLGRTAAVMLLALTAMSGCCETKQSKGIQPDEPPEKVNATQGVRPDARPDAAQGARPDAPQEIQPDAGVSRGARPDMPSPKPEQ